MDNLRGAFLMTLAMAAFAIEDSIVKVLSVLLPVWQIVLLLGCGGSLVFAALTLQSGRPLFSRHMWSLPVLLRNIGELMAVLGFVTALARTELSSASAILQATPLAVTLGAALFLNETVGWRRWSAVGVGFLGVLLIVRPGAAGFDGNAIYAVIAVAGLAVRDVATRRIAPELSSRQISFLAFLIAVPAAALLSLGSDVGWVAPSLRDWGLICGSVAMGGVAYMALIQSSRMGEISFVTPFRYTRIVFALIAAMVFFSERPDALMLVGTVIVVGSGLYTLWRERRALAQ